jgi:hypothetical protein
VAGCAALGRWPRGGLRKQAWREGGAGAGAGGDGMVVAVGWLWALEGFD